MDFYPNKSNGGMMEPIALQDHLVAIHYIKTTNYRRVKFTEGLSTFEVIDLGALGANATGVLTNATRLDLYDGEFGQFRIYPYDDFQLRLFLPRGSARGDLKTIQVPIDPSVVSTDPDLHLTEFFVWEDNRPGMQAINNRAVALTNTRVKGMGFRYITEEVTGPLSRQEKTAVNQLKAESAANPAKKEIDYLLQAITEKMVPCVHVWASGMSAAN